MTILAAHREQLQKLGVKSLSLFGSVARDEAHRDSDVDLLVGLIDKVDCFNFWKYSII